MLKYVSLFATFVGILLLNVAVADAAESALASQYKPDLAANFSRSNPQRAQICLNGVWKISPQLAITEQPPTGDEGYVLVPSSWMHEADMPIESADSTAVHDVGKWKGKPLSEYSSAWYSRQFTVPAAWNGSRVVLVFNRLTISGTIFINGTKVGSQNEWESPSWDITRLIRFDAPNDLKVRVDAALTGEVISYLGAEQTVKSQAKVTLRGITQDVWLNRLPNAPSIDDVFARTSCRRNLLEADVTLSNPTAITGAVQARAVVTSADGKKIALQMEPVNVQLDGKPTQSLTLSAPWRDAILWELDNPYLYKLSVELLRDGKIIDQTFPTDFGFREVWIEGRDVLLNGKPFHARLFHIAAGDGLITTARRDMERLFDHYQAAGYNCIQIASEWVSQRGRSAQFYDDLLELADRRGLLVAMPLVSVTAVPWSQPAGKQEWISATQTFLRRYRNHPSIAFWSMNFNLLGYPWDLNPYAWANGYVPGDQLLDLGDKRRRAKESEEIVRSVDPTRVIYHHAGGNYGQILTSNFYISWPPLQEREEYPLGWAKHGDKPLMPVELGPPVDLDFLRGRGGYYETVRSTEAIEAEYASIYLGASAFTLQEDEYLRILTQNATSAQQLDADRYEINGPYYWGYNQRVHEPVASCMKRIYTTYLRSWRAMGVAGFCPWDSDKLFFGRDPWRPEGVGKQEPYPDLTAPGAKPVRAHVAVPQPLVPLGKELRQVHLPVLAYIGGAEKDNFTAKDHAYFSGESVNKQMVLVNDLRRDVNATVDWQLVSSDGKTAVANGHAKLSVPAGRTGFAPLEFIAPKIAQRTAYSLRLSVAGVPETQLATWGFELEIWPALNTSPNTPVEKEAVCVIDPKGQTKAMLQRMAIACRSSVNGADITAQDHVIVLGRDALAGDLSLAPQVIAAVRSGATLLCFEQSSLDAFGLRLHPRGVRQAFALVTNHPVLEGLQPVDLADWRGDAGLLPAFIEPRDDFNYPVEPWHYGNRGVVATYMIEKPHAGGYRSLLECEYDLGYTPLLEAREGRGRIVFCQLEVTPRYGTDPVATQIAQRLLSYAHQPATPTTSVAVVGDAKLQTYLAELGVESANGPAGVTVAAGTLSGPQRATLLESARQGGTVILLGPDANADLSWIDPTIKKQKQKYYRAAPRTDAKLMTGISISDLFLKDKREDELPVTSSIVEALTEPALISRVTTGQGQFVLLPIDPRDYANSKISPERMNRIRMKLSRTLALLIANAGGSLRGPGQQVASAATYRDLSLPAQWSFSIDINNEGNRLKWFATDFDDKPWRMIPVPGFWEYSGVKEINPNFPNARAPYDGYAWYRCRVVIPESYRGANLSLLLGAVDDMDMTYFNGQKIGATSSDTPAYYIAKRDYPIPQSLIHFGASNVIAVRVFDEGGNGGIAGPIVKIHNMKSNSYPYLNEAEQWNPYTLKRW